MGMPGRCLLHDRSKDSFSVKPQRGATHLVRSSSAVEPCLATSAGGGGGGGGGGSPQQLNDVTGTASPALSFLEHLSRSGFGNASGPATSAAASGDAAPPQGGAQGGGGGAQGDERYFFLAVTDDDASRARYPGLDQVGGTRWRCGARCLTALPWQSVTPIGFPTEPLVPTEGSNSEIWTGQRL